MSQFIKFYFTSSVLNIFRTLIYPSSGACDFSIVSPHWLCVLVSMCFGVSVWLVGVVSVWQAESQRLFRSWVQEWCNMGLMQYCVRLQLYSTVIQLPPHPQVRCLLFLQFPPLQQLSFVVIAIHLLINDLDFQMTGPCPLISKRKRKLKIEMSEFSF